MTHDLVPSDRIEGVPLCGRDGTKIGIIERLMLDKLSGHVAYAVLRYGGTFSPPPRHFPIAWTALKYNPATKVYEADVSIEQLREGPCELDGDAFDWGERGPAYPHPQYWTV